MLGRTLLPTIGKAVCYNSERGNFPGIASSLQFGSRKTAKGYALVMDKRQADRLAKIAAVILIAVLLLSLLAGLFVP